MRILVSCLLVAVLCGCIDAQFKISGFLNRLAGRVKSAVAPSLKVASIRHRISFSKLRPMPGRTRPKFAISRPSTTSSSVDIFFLIDTSGSIGSGNFNTIKTFMAKLLTNVVVGPGHSRAIVITFGTKAQVEVNYLDNTPNHCRFVQAVKNIRYRSGMTNTKAGFDLLKTYIQRSNNRGGNRKKVIFYITDGDWNNGGNPTNSINLVKRLNHVTILSFGIGNVKKNHLREAATSSKDVFYLANFNDMSRVNNAIGSSGVGYVAASSSDCRSCPGGSRCMCSIKTGTFTCQCNAGYYGTTSCRKCLRSSYRSDNMPTSRCENCPRNSVTALEGSSHRSSCYCKPGYNGNPRGGQACTARICDSLGAPSNGHMACLTGFGYGSSCTFRCSDGYRLEGSTQRSCQYVSSANTVRWSGSSTLCRESFCPDLPAPAHGGRTCSNNLKSGSRCTFKCDSGYNLVGNNVRQCTVTKTSRSWTGANPTCKAVSCPKLVNIPNATLKPHSCLTSGGYYSGALCQYQCKPGYTLNGRTDNSIDLNCRHTGRWSDSVTKCVDTEKPKIKCPPSKVIQTLPGRSYGRYDKQAVVQTDNDGSMPAVSKIVDPRLATDNQYPVGSQTLQYKVTYTARDKAGNSAQCTHSVYVEDTEWPKVEYCPSDVTISSLKDNTADVTWKEPVITDNAGTKWLTVTSTRKQGQFGLGSHLVTYHAEDTFCHKVKCSFTIKVAPNNCTLYAPPENGAIVCDKWLEGKFCAVFCGGNTEFVSDPANLYICGFSGKWNTYNPSSAPLPWPNCGRNLLLGGQPRNRAGPLQYYSGSCIKGQSNTKIGEQYVKLLKSTIWGRVGGCPDADCKADNVKITCGKIVSDRARMMSGSKGARFNSCEYKRRQNRPVYPPPDPPI